jgi:hypothetical protein
MDPKDPIENKFKSAFSGFEQPPPPEVWDHVHAALHPVPGPAGLVAWVKKLSFLLHLHPGFYFAFSGAGFVLFVTLGYFVLTGHQAIRGHVYAGTARLNDGQAELFEVADRSMPWDSVKHYRSAVIDHYGHFRFAGVASGRYLLRVSPAEHSETAKRYQPTWFEKHTTSDSCNVIGVKKEDVRVEMVLVGR